MATDATLEQSQSKYTGGALMLVLMCIAASLLTMITFFIALPWAICLVIKFLVDNSIIDGKKLTFDGKGGQLFGNYIIWWLLSIVTFGIYGWLIAPARIYNWVIKHIKFAA
jgi:uncharacterized membrane protein YjgN (DUF898 family)